MNKKVKEVIKAYRKKDKSYDTQGSWTGICVKEGDKPVQDADDL